jgi:hypothetical protein
MDNEEEGKEYVVPSKVVGRIIIDDAQEISTKNFKKEYISMVRVNHNIPNP